MEKDFIFSNYGRFKELFGYILITKFGRQYRVQNYTGRVIALGGKEYINGWLAGAIAEKEKTIVTGDTIKMNTTRA